MMKVILGMAVGLASAQQPHVHFEFKGNAHLDPQEQKMIEGMAQEMQGMILHDLEEREDKHLRGRDFPHHPPHGIFGDMLGRFFGPPPPRAEDEDRIRDEGRHHGHGPPLRPEEMEMICGDDHTKFCPKSHMPFFVTRCLNDHRKELSEKCAEVLPRMHPMRCMLFHFAVTFLMAYACVRIARLTIRYLRSAPAQYPGAVVTTATVVQLDGIELGKVVPAGIDGMEPMKGTAVVV